MAGRKPIWSFFVAGLLILTVGAGSAAANGPARSFNSLNATWVGSAAIVGNCENGKLLFVETGVGFVEQAGLSTWYDKYCVDPITWTTSGRNAVITAENGDKIFMKVELLFVWTSQATGNWIEHETIIGGTGKFATATGGTHSRGTFTLTDPTHAEWEGIEVGLISY